MIPDLCRPAEVSRPIGLRSGSRHVFDDIDGGQGAADAETVGHDGHRELAAVRRHHGWRDDREIAIGDRVEADRKIRDLDAVGE